jgi:hypothetical protein
VARGSATKDRDDAALEKNEEALIKAAQMGEQDEEDLPGPATSAAALMAMDWDESEVEELGERLAHKLIREREERPDDSQLLLAQADFRRKVAASQEDAERLQAEQEENAEKKAAAEKKAGTAKSDEEKEADAKAKADAEKKRQESSR